MNSIISTFHIDWMTLLTQAINFGIVLVVLYLFAIKPISKLMKERTAKIEKGISDAKVNSQVLEESKKEYEKSMAQARSEANELMKEVKKEGEKKKAEMMEDARKEVAVLLENGKKSLESEKEKMITEAKKEVADLAVSITEKILGEKIDSTFQKKAADELAKL